MIRNRQEPPILCLMLLSIVACDADVDEAEFALAEDEPGELAAPETHKKTPPPLAGADALAVPEDAPSTVIQGSHYTWYQNQGAIDMGSTADRFCFLTEMQGRFEGAGERIHVYQYGGKWWLAGISQQTGMKASAACIPLNYWGQNLTYSGEYTITSDDPATDIGSAVGRVCFLTMIEGKFEGDGEYVHLYRTVPYPQHWMFVSDDQLTTPGPALVAKARCVTTGYVSSVGNWSLGDSHPWMASAEEWVCGLTRVRGKFEGSGERVATYVYNGNWYIGGHSGQDALAASGICI